MGKNYYPIAPVRGLEFGKERDGGFLVDFGEGQTVSVSVERRYLKKVKYVIIFWYWYKWYQSQSPLLLKAPFRRNHKSHVNDSSPFKYTDCLSDVSFPHQHHSMCTSQGRPSK